MIQEVIKPTLEALELDQVDCIDEEIVNVFLTFNTGKGYYEGGMSVDVAVSSQDGYIIVDELKVNFVEDEDENEIEFACDIKELENKIEGFLGNVMNSSMNNENERQLIAALS